MKRLEDVFNLPSFELLPGSQQGQVQVCGDGQCLAAGCGASKLFRRDWRALQATADLLLVSRLHYKCRLDPWKQTEYFARVFRPSSHPAAEERSVAFADMVRDRLASKGEKEKRRRRRKRKRRRREEKEKKREREGRKRERERKENH